MSKDYHAEALKSTRETALNAVPKIAADIERYGSSGHKDAQKHKIIYALNVLTTICRNCEALRETAHYDIYIDIFTKVLEPKLEPQASPNHWKRVLSTLEYLFVTLAEFSVHSEAYKLHTYISKIQLKWPDADDFRNLLSIHGSQLHMLIKRQQKGPHSDAIIKDRVIETLAALEKLFVNMAARCREEPIDSTVLVTPFIGKIITKNPSIQMQLATTFQCEQMECMYKAFLVLCSANSKFASSEGPFQKFQEHIQALYYFLQIDIHSKLKQHVALQYACIVCNIAIFETDERVRHCTSILCNLLKLTDARSYDRGNFKETYSLFCIKLCQFLTQSGKVLMQEFWFQDVVVFMFFFFHSVHTATNSVFDTYRQQMDTSLYILNIKIFAENPNTWFHIQLSYIQIGLETYTQMLKISHEDTPNEVNANSISSVKAEISTFLQQSIDTLISMENECTKSAVAVRKLCVTFAKLLQESNQCTHAPDLFSLATDMTRLKSRISSEDWLMIMSRINKNVLKCKDATLAADILSCYIAELICNTTHVDFMTLHKLILYHHYGTPGISLYETYCNLASPFKPLLQKSEKRYFHWLETQYVNKYYDKEKHFTIFTIMAQRSQTKYDFINAVHAGKLLNQSSMFSKVQNIYEVLRSKKRNGKKIRNTALTRLEELTLAHTISLLLSKRLEEQKVSISSKDFHETNIPQLLQEKSLISLSVTKEMEMIDMAREAVNAFESFFNKVDFEPLPTSDGSFLDWERILEDLTSLASYFQLTGYLDHALETWLLQYRIANTVDDIQSSLRSLTFFCEYNSFIEKDTRLQLSNEINSKNASLKYIPEYLTQLSKRQQNFTLTCVCQIAYYHASRKRIEKAKILLNLVKHLHKNKLNRQGTYDIVLFTVDVVSFRILWKLVSPTKCKEWLMADRRLLSEIDMITERLRTYVNISSADMRPYTILFLNSIDEFAEFAAIRMCDNFLSGYLSSALKLCVEGGFAVRTAQVLCKWVFINLQMEYLQKAEIKMQFVECILDLRDFKEIASSLQTVRSCAMSASKELQNGDEYDMHHVGPEEVRKVAALGTPSPIKIKDNYISAMALDHKLESCNYPEENTENPERLSHVVLWSRFTLSCLRARFNFLSFEYENLQTFYENCEKWLEKRLYTIHFQIYQSIVLVCMLHRANFLRANKNYEKALQHLEKCIEHCTTLEGEVDESYLINFKLQLQDTKLEQIENKTRNLPIKEKPNLFGSLLHEIKMTPAAKPIKYKPLAMTSYKKPSSSSSSLKTADFIVYSDRKSPRKAQVTHIKPMAAMKTLIFNKNSSERGSSSEKENLDTCQVIEISDSDCDFDVDIEKPKAVAKTPKPQKKLTQKKQHQPSRLKFLDSVELEDFDVPKPVEIAKTKSIKSKKTKKAEKSKDELPILVDEMQNLAIAGTSLTSKIDRTHNRSPKLVKKMSKPPELSTPCIEIVCAEESPPLMSTASILSRSTRNNSTKQLKTPDTSAVILPETTTTGRRRLPPRQARLENITPPTTTLSLRRRQRN